MRRSTLLVIPVLLATLVPPTATAAAGGTFEVLTYNVAGLPEGLSSATLP
ncbi:hypothetical protein [Lentzea indica]|nr:hypothetical protein [Lentzea indica]